MSELLMERDKYCTHQHMLAQIWRFIFISRKFCLAGQAQLTQHYIAVASFRLEGKLLAEMWTQGFFIFFNFNFQLVARPHYHVPPSGDSAPVACIDSITLSLQHAPLVRIVVRDSRFSVSFLELCFFFLLSNGCNFQCSEVQYFSQNLLK